MKIVFMGTPEFAVPSLLKLNNDQEIEVEAVVTQPDRKSGRGQKVHYSDIKEKALENDLEVMQSKNV
ncbi:MAG: methionyl-tRNA formyltransferase, partial [Halanaerobium sp.]